MSISSSSRRPGSFVFAALLIAGWLFSPVHAYAQCPDVSALTLPLGQDLGEFSTIMDDNGYMMSNFLELSEGKKVYYFTEEPDQSSSIKITTNPEGLCMYTELKSAFHNCWESFVTVAKADPLTYEERLGADKEIDRLGMYDVAGMYRVIGSSRINSDGRTEISLLASLIDQ